MKLTKKYNISDRTLVDNIIEFLTAQKHTWNDNSDILTVNSKDGNITVEFPKTEEDGEFTFSFNKAGSEWLERIEKWTKMEITDKDIEQSVFSSVPASYIKDGTLFSLKKNKIAFDQLEKFFKDFGFKTVGIKNYPTEQIDQFYRKTLTLVIEPYDRYGNSSSFDVNLFSRYNSLVGYSVPSYNNSAKIKPIYKEKTVPMLINNIEVGTYYPERNLVLLYFNPFFSVNLTATQDINSIEYVKKVLSDLTEVFTGVKLKTIDNTKFMLKILIGKFNEKSKQRIGEMKRRIEKLALDIETYQNALTSAYTEQISTMSQISALDVVNENAMDVFIEEIEKTKKEGIVTDVNFEGGEINITFIPTTIKTKVGRSVEGDSKGPIVEMLVGPITCHICGDGRLRVTSPNTYKNNAHPHASGESPCLGGGEGPSMMHRMIAERKFSAFIYYFWMWIKRYRPEDCYVKPWEWYDFCLKTGLPVFNASGKRIEINDESLIKSGVQIKLKKDPSYDENTKKYAGIKPSG